MTQTRKKHIILISCVFLLISMRIIEKGGLPIGKPPFISIPIYYIRCINSRLDNLAPVFLSLADIAAITEFSHTLSLREEFLSFIRISLLNTQITYLSKEEVTEVSPVRLLRIKREWVLALIGQQWVVAPQVPVTAIHSEFGFYPYRPYASDRG